LKPKKVEKQMKTQKIECMMKCMKNMENFLSKENKKRLMQWRRRLWTTRLQEISNWKMKREERSKSKKKTWIRSKNTSPDWDKKWKMRDKCNSRKESKKENIFKRCSKKMKKISKELSMRRNFKDSKISKLRKSILPCLKSKKLISSMKWRRGNKELKNSWIKWPTMFFRKWTRNKNKKMKCLWDMKMKEKWDKD